jgi:hypothetical protein
MCSLSIHAGRNRLNRKTGNALTCILHESEAFICKALKGEVVFSYFEPLITQQMKASDSPEG